MALTTVPSAGGSGLFLVGFIGIRRRIPEHREWPTVYGPRETTKMTTLMEQEKQRISQRLARRDAEREKLSGELDEGAFGRALERRKSGSQLTLQWRETDSNPRSPVRERRRESARPVSFAERQVSEESNRAVPQSTRWCVDTEYCCAG
jgi:hypothetical protein